MVICVLQAEKQGCTQEKCAYNADIIAARAYIVAHLTHRKASKKPAQIDQGTMGIITAFCDQIGKNGHAEPADLPPDQHIRKEDHADMIHHHQCCRQKLQPVAGKKRKRTCFNHLT